MNGLWQRVRLRAGLRRGDDRGVTLMEVTVTVTIMSIVMAIFTTGILQIFKATNQVERISVAQSQLTIAMAKLDKEIRYSKGISAPKLYTDGNWYVEYLIGFTGTETCHQLRLNTTTKKLEKRTWARAVVPLVATVWLPLASGVSAPKPAVPPPAVVDDATSRDPFYRPQTQTSFQRLRLWLFTSPGGADVSTPAETKIVFTALNAAPEPTDTLCTDGRGVA